MPATTTSSRKRKITEEAVESPPKRQTRARAAKATLEDSTTKPKTTRITTASARIAAEARATTKSAPKTRTATTISAKRGTKATKDTAKPAKVHEKAVASITGASSRSETRAIKSKDKPIEQEVPKPRSRKVKTADPEVKRTVRTRSATIETEAGTKMDTNGKKVVKRVTFQEDLLEEKENKPTTTKKEPTTGIKAKPIRKIIKTPTATRSKKTATTNQVKLAPLSPKKVTQVAKSLSSSEDELMKTPPSKTSKTQEEATKKGEAISEPKHSPVKAKVLDASTLLASPAKRPPASPFRDGLSQSPKKFSIPSAMPDFGKAVSLESDKESLKQPPMKFDFTPARSAAGKPDVGLMARAALLGSPARRPASPLKLGSARMPEKTGTPRALTNTTSIIRHVKDGSLFSATPRRLFKSPAKTASQSPTKQPETITSNVAEAMIGVEDPTISDTHTTSPCGLKNYSETVRFGDSQEVFEHDVFEDSGHYRSLEDNSEDELSMGPLTSSPQKRAMLMKRLAPSSPSSTLASPAKPLATPGTRVKNQFMTPLAVQLSNWLATSPTRPEPEEDLSRSAFTPATKVSQTGRASRRTTMTPVARSTCFEEQLPQIDVAATPEESMLNQDLHTKDDFDMVDDIVSDSAEEVIAATPEELFQQSGITIPSDHKESVMKEVQNFDDMTDINPSVLLDTFMDLGTTENTIFDCISGTVDMEIVKNDNIPMPDDSMNLEGDETVIVTRSQAINPEENAHSTIEDKPQQMMDILSEVDTSVVAPASSSVSSEHMEQYGDENCEPTLFANPQTLSEVDAIAEALHTPNRPFTTRQKEIRTVARVPLKPSSNETPLQLKVRKGRSKSMFGEADLVSTELLGDIAGKDHTSKKTPEPVQNAPATPRSISQPLKPLATSGDELITLAQTPFKSARKGPDASILRGAVVHVDVHTSEGADASSIFVELLTQMGARCIKQWNWNPRATLSGGEDLASNAKVGITHVVFKDGSKRTLQKVREAKGLVLCVGVGWVLE